jgi:quinol monooxygenase YgiN
MDFLQIVEFQTSRLEEIRAVLEQWRQATEGRRTATSMRITNDRDRRNKYLWIVEFPSHEDAMRNHDMPETQQMMQQIIELSEGEPVFRNLELIDEIRS